MTHQQTPATQTFTFNTQAVRTVNREGEPWFVAKDVCDVLGLTNSRQAVASLDEDEAGVCTIYISLQRRSVSIISESGLFALIFQSRKAEAKVFRKWVTSTVLPAIRKTGSYVGGEERLDPTAPDYMDRLKDLLLEAKERKLEEAEKKVEELTPQADAFMLNMTMHNGYGLQEYARSKGLGPNKFARWLQDEGFISKTKRGNKTKFTPYAKKNRGGIFETVKHKHGQLVRITPAGVIYFDKMVADGKLDHIRS